MPNFDPIHGGHWAVVRCSTEIFCTSDHHSFELDTLLISSSSTSATFSFFFFKVFWYFPFQSEMKKRTLFFWICWIFKSVWNTSFNYLPFKKTQQTLISGQNDCQKNFRNTTYFVSPPHHSAFPNFVFLSPLCSGFVIQPEEWKYIN